MHSDKKAVVLLSGGIDSATTLAIAKAEGFELYALSFNYNQRHQRELKSAEMIAEDQGVQRHLTIQFDLGMIGGSALTADIAVPKNRGRESHILDPYSTEEAGNRRAKMGDTRHPVIPATYVPARNTIFLSFALAWAEVLHAGSIFIGANAVDYSGYPDCRPEYLRAFEIMANLGTKASVEGTISFQIQSPLLHMTKAEIIQTGSSLGLDYALTWSCYDPQSDGRPCRRCDSCLFREKGFSEAGIKDPLV